ncbi:MAG: FtsX-like permease family protein, partial [Eubacteriales bacterium]|nr:FtsX-like permease family protein [Eubacteriales bacterium]
MGIFLSMGFSKGKIMRKLIMENLLVFAGSFLIAVPVVFLGVRFLGSMLDISGAVLKAGNVLAVGMGGLVFCAVVTALSSIKIMRVNPKEILVMSN